MPSCPRYTVSGLPAPPWHGRKFAGALHRPRQSHASLRSGGAALFSRARAAVNSAVNPPLAHLVARLLGQQQCHEHGDRQQGPGLHAPTDEPRSLITTRATCQGV